MKAIYLHAAGAIALTFGIAACVPRSTPPAPTPPPVVTPAPTPTASPVVQQPVYENYLDAPQTPGDWRYSDDGGTTLAYFGSASDTDRAFALSCNRNSRQITMGRPGRTSDRMTIRTETNARTIAAGSGRIVSPASTEATLTAQDPLLDAMALSKGRFAVETPGFPTLHLPAWAEVSRVIEDCR